METITAARNTRAKRSNFRPERRSVLVEIIGIFPVFVKAINCGESKLFLIIYIRSHVISIQDLVKRIYYLFNLFYAGNIISPGTIAGFGG